MKISFIGLGIMGSRMAANLIKSGIEVTVYNRSEAPVMKLSEKGGKVASTLKEALDGADLVFTMLSRPEAVREVMLNQGLSQMDEGSLWVDCSTVNPSFTLEANEATKKVGIKYLEAPVAGSSPQAEAAELVIFVGGDKSDLEKTKPYLEKMSKKIIHLGEIGKGASFKLVVNMLLGHSMIAFAEALKFGQSMGLGKEFLLNTLPSLPVSAPFTQAKAKLINEENYEPQFPLELLHKDLHLSAVTAAENGLVLAYTESAQALYAEAIENGLGRMDMSAIYKHLDE